jgi:diguanylate cyclase (GGDEF)-like protein
MLLYIEYSIIFVLVALSIVLLAVQNPIFLNYYTAPVIIALVITVIATFLTYNYQSDVSKHLLFVAIFGIIWLPLFIQPGILNNGLTVLVFSTCLILYTSMFYSTRHTFICALVQIITGAFIIIINPQTHHMNWHILIIYYLIFIILAIVSTSTFRRYISLIDHQKHELNIINRELLSKERELYKLAFYDSLTGLGTQYKFIQDIQGLMDQNQNFYIIDIDVDYFGFINETLGHSVGNNILVELAKNIMDNTSSEYLYRWGEDEFIIIVITEKTDDVQKILKKINRQMKNCTSRYRNHIQCSISAGIAFHPLNGQSMERLLQSVNMALDHAKNTGKNKFAFYTASLQRRIDKIYRIQALIDQSILLNSFTLYLQPIFSLKDQKLHSAEILLRAPDIPYSLSEIIDVAEMSNQIVDIDMWVLKNVFVMLNNNKDLLTDIIISINLSSRSFKSSELLIYLDHLIKTYNIDATRLTLEITEYSLIQDFESSSETIDALHQRGFRIAIDDFGTKYSSLNYISKLQLDVLKIDKSYIDNITTNQNDRFIVKHLLALSKDLNLSTIAEGIECIEQQDLLEELNCDYGQGFLLARPMPFEDFMILKTKNIVTLDQSSHIS